MGQFAIRAAIVLLPLALAGCFGSDGGQPSVMEGAGPGPQPFPDNYRSDLLAYMRVYLKDPVGVRDAAVAEPVLREVGGRPFYVACLRFTPRESDGSYKGLRERAVVYVNGRLDRVIERSSELCPGAVYASFPELEKMMR